MRKKVIFCIIMLVSGYIYAAKLGSIPDIFKPIQIALDDTAIYISDQNKIRVYSLKDFKLLRTIGGYGEGPGEFLYGPKIKIQKDDVLLYSFTKFSRFTKDGKLLVEKKLAGPILGDIYPIGGNYIIQSATYDVEWQQVEEVNIFGKDLKKYKTLYSYVTQPKTSGGKRIVQLLNSSLFIQCEANKIFLAGGKKESCIEIFDSKGNFQKRVNIPYTRIKITAEYSKMREKDFLKTFTGTQKEKILKTFQFVFPLYFPAIRNFIVDFDKIYIRTYVKMDNQEEYIILDLNGNLLGKVLLPEMQTEIFTIYKNKLYFLKDNETEETWELHCLDIAKGNSK